MTLITLLGVGDDVLVTAAAPADPQLNMFWNRVGMFNTAYNVYSANTYSVYGIQLPNSMSFKRLAFNASLAAAAGSSISATIRVGLYTLNASTLSLANSASGSFSLGGAATSTLWVDISATSANQNMAPGQYWLGYGVSTGAAANFVSSLSLLGGTSMNPAGAMPYPIFGHMTVSSAAPPTSIATSDLDITGNDALRQAAIILTA